MVQTSKNPIETSNDGDVLPPGGLGRIPPLIASGLCITKAALIEALRLYVPGISDIEIINGERFLLALGPVPTRPSLQKLEEGD